MGKGEVSIRIARPTHDVFAVIADVRRHPRWSPSSIEGQLLTSGPVGVGTRARETTRVFGRRITVTSEVTAFDEDRLLAYATSGGPFPFRGSFETEAADGGTRLTASFETEAPGVLRFAGGLFTRLARRQLAASLANLRRLMEAGEL